MCGLIAQHHYALDFLVNNVGKLLGFLWQMESS